MVVTNTTEPTLLLRERKRLRAMKHVQREAVARFTADGFDAVTVEEIAAAADVSAMSVYRWFGTKEALVIWDEFDPPILAAVADRLAEGRRPLTAVRDAFVDLLDQVYDREHELALARTRLIFREPALLTAASANTRLLRTALTDLFVRTARLAPVDARVAAAVATALLETALDAWQHDDGRRPLAEQITEAFAALGGLS